MSDVSQLELVSIKAWIEDKGYEPLSAEQEMLLDVMCQFKGLQTSPIAAAINVVINHADKIHKLTDLLEEIQIHLGGQSSASTIMSEKIKEARHA